jgi:hypothetical protein
VTYLDPYHQSAESIDQVRRTLLERSGSRPVSKLRGPAPENAKPRQRALGRLRTAAWRCSLDTKRRPESDVVGLALLAAVATQDKTIGFDPASARIVGAALDDLISRGYDRNEILAVFKRFRKNLRVAPDVTPSNNVV